MAWLRALFAFISNLWNLWRQQKTEQQLQQKSEQLQAEEAALEATRKVQDAVNKVPSPELDSSEKSVDPLGFDDFNRRHGR